MTTKLIMVEGIQGSGKSTTAQKIADYYRSQNRTVNFYSEGQLHPADLAWCAYIPMDTMDGLLQKYQAIAPEIKNNMRIEGNKAIVAYTLVQTDDTGFYKEFEKFEIYDQRVSSEDFRKILITRWRNFAQQAANKDELNLFECAFLQNPVSELLNFQLANEQEIEAYMNELAATIECLSPVLIYLSPTDVKATIQRVAEKRTFADGKWIDAMMDYTARTPYGKLHKLEGLDGVVYSIETRKRIELDIIRTLPMRTVVIENNDGNWGAQWESITAYLNRL